MFYYSFLKLIKCFKPDFICHNSVYLYWKYGGVLNVFLKMVYKRTFPNCSLTVLCFYRYNHKKWKLNDLCIAYNIIIRSPHIPNIQELGLVTFEKNKF